MASGRLVMMSLLKAESVGEEWVQDAEGSASSALKDGSSSGPVSDEKEKCPESLVPIILVFCHFNHLSPFSLSLSHARARAHTHSLPFPTVPESLD